MTIGYKFTNVTPPDPKPEQWEQQRVGMLLSVREHRDEGRTKSRWTFAVHGGPDTIWIASGDARDRATAMLCATAIADAWNA